jgi:hypothetical protein
VSGLLCRSGALRAAVARKRQRNAPRRHRTPILDSSHIIATA